MSILYNGYKKKTPFLFVKSNDVAEIQMDVFTTVK